MSQMAERLGSRSINQKVVGPIPAMLKDVVSYYLPLGKCPCTYCVSLWIRVSAK